MRRESNLWHSVEPHFTRSGVFSKRIETTTEDGMPDLFVCEGKEWFYWIELKAISDFPVRATTRVFGSEGLRPEQVAWAVSATHRKVPCAILASVGVKAHRSIFLLPGAVAPLFNSMTTEELLLYKVELRDLVKKLKNGVKVR